MKHKQNRAGRHSNHLKSLEFFILSHLLRTRLGKKDSNSLLHTKQYNISILQAC